MPGDEAEHNAAVLADRINRLQADVNDLGMTISNTREQVNVLSRDKLNRAEFIEWTRNAQEWREKVVEHLAKIDERVGRWAAGNVVVSVLAGLLAFLLKPGP